MRRRLTIAAVIGLVVVSWLSAPALALPTPALPTPAQDAEPSDPAAETAETDDTDAGDGNGGDAAGSCPLARDAGSGFDWKQVSCWIGTGVAALSLLWLAVAAAVVWVPKDANTGFLGSLRRAREQIPSVGRVFKPRIDLEVLETSGEAGPISRSLIELIVEEMVQANRSDVLEERLMGDQQIAEDLATSIEQAKPGWGGLAKSLAAKLPRARIHLRGQLHQPTDGFVSMSMDILNRRKRVVASGRFLERTGQTDASDETKNVADHYLLIRPVAAWLTFELAKLVPGDRTDALRPMNTDDAASYGSFRLGLALEDFGSPAAARRAYHRAITEDSDNAGASLNLARLDMRELDRLDECLDRLRDARLLLDQLDDEHERTELLVRTLYLRTVARLHEALVALNTNPSDRSALSDRERASSLAYVDAAWNALIQMARELHRLRALAEPAGLEHLADWEARPQRELGAIREAFTCRALTLAAALEAEYEWLIPGRSLRHQPLSDVDAAVELLGRGVHLRFDDLERLLLHPGRPLPAAARYNLGCALARRHEFDRAARFIGDAVRGEEHLYDWAVSSAGDPSLDDLRETQWWAQVCYQPGTASAAATST